MEIDRSLVSGSMALLVMKLLEDGDRYENECATAKVAEKLVVLVDAFPYSEEK